MDNSTWTPAVHQGHVDDGRVVVARVLPRAEQGCQRRETPVRLLAGPRVAPVYDPVE